MLQADAAAPALSNLELDQMHNNFGALEAFTLTSLQVPDVHAPMYSNHLWPLQPPIMHHQADVCNQEPLDQGARVDGAQQVIADTGDANVNSLCMAAQAYGDENDHIYPSSTVLTMPKLCEMVTPIDSSASQEIDPLSRLSNGIYYQDSPHLPLRNNMDDYINTVVSMVPPSSSSSPMLSQLSSSLLYHANPSPVFADLLGSDQHQQAPLDWN